MVKNRILVVEDEAITACDLQLRLRQMGYDVPLIAATGEQAVEKAREIKPDLLLMDIMLAGDIDGIEAAKQIRTIFDVPVIYLSAYTDKMLSERAKITEPFGYLSKPFADNDLRNTIDMALYKHGAERTLRHQIEFTEAAIDAQIDTFFVFEPETRKAIRWNKKFREISGYTDEEIASQPAPDSYYGRDDLEKVGEMTTDVFRSGEGKIHMSLICKDGRMVPTEYIASTFKDRDSNKLYIIAIGRDIRERIKLEETRRENEILMKNAQRIGHLGFWDWNTSSGSLYWSDETFRIYGFEPQAFEPTFDKFKSILFPDDRERVIEKVDAALKGIEPYNIDFRFVYPDGKVGWIHCVGEVSLDENGNPVRFFGTQTDITERKRNEKEHQYPEEDVARRNRELETELAEMRELAGRLSERVTSSQNGYISFLERYIEIIEDGTETHQELSHLLRHLRDMKSIISDFSHKSSREET